MRASYRGERKFTGPDFTRLRKSTAAGAMPRPGDLLEGILFQPEASGDYVT